MKTILKTIATAVFLGAITLPTLAQDATTPAPTPPAPPAPFCENNPGFADWDFWVGEWNVYSNDEARTFAGTNSITKHYNNCLIMENWLSAGGGGAGFSINYYNPVKEEWRQTWVANGYSIDYTGGLNEAGEMVLNGFIYGYRAGKTTPFRGTWSEYDNGDTRQFFEVHNAEGEWTTWFDGLYVRKETDPNPPASE